MNLRNPALVWSLVVAIGVLVLDRLHKLVQVDLAGWVGGESVTLAPFFNYVLVWNPGISYGLLDGLPPEGLLAIMAGAVLLLLWWWWTDSSFLTRVGIAFVVGGAVSNAVDRIVYGAVADFFHFHAFGWSFYVFNIADMAISLGVILLIADVFRPRRREAQDSPDMHG